MLDLLRKWKDQGSEVKIVYNISSTGGNKLGIIQDYDTVGIVLKNTAGDMLAIPYAAICNIQESPEY